LVERHGLALGLPKCLSGFTHFVIPGRSDGGTLAGKVQGELKARRAADLAAVPESRLTAVLGRACRML